MEALEQELRYMKKLLAEKDSIIEALTEKLKIYDRYEFQDYFSYNISLSQFKKRIKNIILGHWFSYFHFFCIG